MREWPRHAFRVATLVDARRRERQQSPTVTTCDACSARGPWIAVDHLTAWVVCPGCQVDLRRFTHALDAYGRDVIDASPPS